VLLLAKVLQAVGVADVGIALWFGIAQDDMWQELYFALAGVVFFGVGRLLERRA
jgi:hypothetical protein